jgi:tetratricopeptide (TPR) repeat protein
MFQELIAKMAREVEKLSYELNVTLPFEIRKAVELAPQYADGLNNLGVMLAEKGQTAEAIALFERALRVRPDYPDAQVNLRRTREALLQTGRIP